MPQWLINIIVKILSTYVTPEIIKELETEAIQMVCCKLAALAKQTATPIDDELVAKVAAALGADLSKCPA